MEKYVGMNWIDVLVWSWYVKQMRWLVI